jgi:hypothetical protein
MASPPHAATWPRQTCRGFSILEALLMLGLLTVFTMVLVALWIKQPASLSEEEKRWQSSGGDASQLTPGLPTVEDPSLVPEMTSDTEIRLEKVVPPRETPE